MPTPNAEREAAESLNAHAAARGREIHDRYGPQLGWRGLQKLLQDSTFVRYPCEIVFDSRRLLPGECAHPACKGDRPEDGFEICVHPLFMTQLDKVPYLVLYQLVLVNYGEFAGADDAEIFGATALGLSKDDYYDALCALADQLGTEYRTSSQVPTGKGLPI